MINASLTHLATIREILQRYAFDCEVRVFGSRIHHNAKHYSDLDLALVGSRKRTLDEMGRLREAFENSDLPYRVDVLDWHAISPEFRQIIEQGYEVIQTREEIRHEP
jgi:uncharacterized protein